MIDIMKRNPVIPVMVIDDIADAVPLAQAIVDGGLDVLEITLRTAVAIDAVKLIKENVAGAIVGTGTVIDSNSYELSRAAEVDFMVSPGSTENILNLALKDKINLLPGCATPSEAMKLLELGFNCQKFFPAEAAGGTAMLKSIAGPLPQITFCPTGGINMKNAPNYLSLANVACIGGSWMLDKTLIKEKNWSGISQLCKTICDQLKDTY